MASGERRDRVRAALGSRLARRTLWAVMASCLAGAVSGMLIWQTTVLDGLEASTYDARMQIRGERESPPDKVLVLIDDSTFVALNRRRPNEAQFPFTRRFHARVIDRLREDGAEVIAYDIQFTERSPDPGADQALVNAVDRAPKVVLATTEIGRNGSHGVLGGRRTLDAVGARAGDATLLFGSGGAIRETTPNDSGLDTFPLAVTELEAGTEINFDHWAPARDAWIDFRGPPGSYEEVSFGDVLFGEFEPGTFTGKTVLVGAAAPSLQDLHPTPTSDVDMPGVEIHANAAETIASEWPLRTAPDPASALLVLGLAGLPLLFFSRLPPATAFAALLGTVAAFVLGTQLSFGAGVVVPVVAPIAAVSVAGLGALGSAYVGEAFARQRTRDTMARFASDEIVDELLASDRRSLLGGRRFEVTVLFSDIRGFSTFSESRPPEEVVAILNRYLTGMTDAILDNGGVISSFIGDGIMATFGAPVAHPDHADRALRAAEEMLGPQLDEFNEWLTAAFQIEPFRMGVGLNSGPVISGTIGSERRLDYTAIGDTVNTAARLEGMTKGTPHDLFIADSTRDRLTDAETMARLQFVEEMEVRGRARSIGIWAPG